MTTNGDKYLMGENLDTLNKLIFEGWLFFPEYVSYRNIIISQNKYYTISLNYCYNFNKVLAIHTTASVLFFSTEGT